MLVALTVISEFVRGGRVIARHTGQNLVASHGAALAHRNTRRYGGYIVHFGVVVVMIGFAGSAFNQDKEQELGYGDKMRSAPYTLACRSYTQDDKPNYSSEWAIIDVCKGGKPIATHVSRSAVFTRPASRPRPWWRTAPPMKEDLYLVYEGRNQETGRPIIKAHLNPLVMWIWIGLLVMVAGTVVALVPNSAAVRLPVRSPVHAAAAEAGD